MSLLSGARNEKKIDLGEQLVDRINVLFLNQPDVITSASILLANIYGLSGSMKKSLDIRIKLNQSRAKKRMAISWTSINGQLVVNHD